MEKIGGGDQRYWSAKAATLNENRFVFAKNQGSKDVTQIFGAATNICMNSGAHCSPEIAQKKTFVNSLQALLLFADQVEELMLADVAVLVGIKHGHHVAHLEMLDILNRFKTMSLT